MKTTFELPDELFRELKIRAAVQGRTVKELVAECIRRGLGLSTLESPRKAPGSSMVSTGADGLPVIRCESDAAATRMNLEDLLQLERESQFKEDMQRAGVAL